MLDIKKLFKALDYSPESETYTGSVGVEKVLIQRISDDYPFCNEEEYTWECIVSFESEWLDSVRNRAYSAKEAFSKSYS